LGRCGLTTASPSKAIRDRAAASSTSASAINFERHPALAV
jgi:hypothetical protein